MSFFHRLHPLTKLAMIVLLIAMNYLLPGLWLPPVLFGLLLLVAISSGELGGLLRTVASIVLPVTLSLFLIQGILFPPPNATPLPLGPLTLTIEGLQFAYLIAARLTVFATAIVLLLRITQAADLVFALIERGLPRSIGYILLAALQLVPDMGRRATSIIEAQRSRGLETEGGLRRVRAIVPLLGPLVVGALVDVEERAMAIESRAFLTPGPKTTLRQLVDPFPEKVARSLIWLTLLGLIGWRIWEALGGS
jgi:energy-coupling factor transport system permease protein